MNPSSDQTLTEYVVAVTLYPKYLPEEDILDFSLGVVDEALLSGICRDLALNTEWQGVDVFDVQSETVNEQGFRYYRLKVPGNDNLIVTVTIRALNEGSPSGFDDSSERIVLKLEDGSSIRAALAYDVSGVPAKTLLELLVYVFNLMAAVSQGDLAPIAALPKVVVRELDAESLG